MDHRVGISFDFEKTRSDGGYVRGWASVVSVDGKPVVDHSGHVVTMSALRDAAHSFISEQRIAKVMHKGEQIGDVCEAIIVDDDLCKALGASTPYRGLFIGMKINDAEIKKQIRGGDLKMFSIGGRGRIAELDGSEDLKALIDGSSARHRPDPQAPSARDQPRRRGG